MTIVFRQIWTRLRKEHRNVENRKKIVVQFFEGQLLAEENKKFFDVYRLQGTLKITACAIQIIDAL